DAVSRRHDRLDAELRARRAGEAAERDATQAEVDDLAARREPDPPRAPWPTARSGPCLAELIDFADHVSRPERAGLEAALEAAGLLVAEVRADGAIEAGDLRLGPTGELVPAPLSELVTVVVPEAHRDWVDAGALTAVL